MDRPMAGSLRVAALSAMPAVLLTSSLRLILQFTNSIKTLKTTRWTPEEKSALESLAGNVLPRMLVGSYNRWAKKNGYPERTNKAIYSALGRRRLSRKAEGEWVTSSYIATVLGVSIDVPQRWAERNLIASRKNAGRSMVRYFRRTDILAFAKKRPDLLGGIASEKLFLLLEDEELAESIALAFPKRKGAGRMIKAVESGQVYPSVVAAAKEVFATRQGIHSAIRNNGTCAGFHWIYV